MPTITSVLGPVEADGFDAVLAAETLLCAPPARLGNAGGPASEAELERAPVSMPLLGRLMLGAVNRDDRALAETDAEAALCAFAEHANGAVVALAGRGSTASPASLTRLGRASGVTIVRGTDGSACTDSSDGADPPDAADADPEHLGERIAADLVAMEAPAGIVGAIPIPAMDAAPGGRGVACARIEAAATAARGAGAALVLAPQADPWGVSLPAAPRPAALERALAAVDAAGLDRSRVVLLGAASLVAARPDGAPALGVDNDRLEALLALGTAICFDDLGRIPNVHTAVSDHDIALAILRCAELGAGERALLSSGIRNKHRLTAFGGNGLEFVPQQFLPYLGMLGAEAALLAGVGGGNAARILARTGETS